MLSLQPFCEQQLNLNKSCTHAIRSSDYGGGWKYVFTYEALNPYIIAGHDGVSHDSRFNYIDHVDSISRLAYPVHMNFVHADIPLQDIPAHLFLQMGLKIARLHHIPIGSHVTKSEFCQYFEGHNCASCTLYSSIFSVVESNTVKDKN